MDAQDNTKDTHKGRTARRRGPTGARRWDADAGKFVDVIDERDPTNHYDGPEEYDLGEVLR